MQTVDFLRKHRACREGAKWALSISEDMVAVWDALIEQDKYDWLIWTATRRGVFPDSVLRKLACRFVRETPLHDGRTAWDLLTDERSRKAIEVAEHYVDGKATEAELDAARADAWAAYDAARTAADAAAGAAADAARAAADADRAAAWASDAASDAADRASAWSVWSAYDASRADATYAAEAAAARVAAKSAQVEMIAEIGNPFKK